MFRNANGKDGAGKNGHVKWFSGTHSGSRFPVLCNDGLAFSVIGNRSAGRAASQCFAKKRRNAVRHRLSPAAAKRLTIVNSTRCENVDPTRKREREREKKDASHHMWRWWWSFINVPPHPFSPTRARWMQMTRNRERILARNNAKRN